LTGDENILKLMMVVQYKLRDPVDYLFNTTEPDWLVERVVESAMCAALSWRGVDEVLTSAKSEIQIGAIADAQELLDRYGAGISLLGGNLQVVSPPEPVIAAFNDVTAAKKDSESAIESARTYANYLVPGARGDAAQILGLAHGNADVRVNRAKGETARFLNILEEYRGEPELTRQRLYLETLERVLAKVNTVVVDDRSRVNILGD
ncbi:MAG: FtsH protease activity modulator HflK, partial [bacterium]